jgi:flagellar biosynthesis protein FliP
MFMLSPPVISLPCKLLLFVLVDGWALVCNGVAQLSRQGIGDRRRTYVR